MKNTKRKFELFSFYDKDAINSHLEKMAAKGWMLDHITPYYWVYKRIEPKKLHFSVAYFPEADELDPQPSSQQLMFQDFCAHSGWQLATSSAQMHFFYNEKENPIPIETDPKLELQAIQKTAKKGFILSNSILLIMVFISLIFLSKQQPIQYFSDWRKIISTSIIALIFLYTAINLIGYAIWLTRAKKAAELGEFLKPISTARFQKTIILSSLALLLVYAFIAVSAMENTKMKWVYLCSLFNVPLIVLILNLTKPILKHYKVSKEIHRVIALFVCLFLSFGFVELQSVLMSDTAPAETYEYKGVVYELHHDELPLVLEDLMDVKNDDYSYEKISNSTLFLSHEKMFQSPRLDIEDSYLLPSLSYQIVDVKLPWLYNLCKDTLFTEKEHFSNSFLPIDAKALQANEVYRLFDENHNALNWYIICYDEQIIQLYIDQELDDEQFRIIKESLIV